MELLKRMGLVEQCSWDQCNISQRVKTPIPLSMVGLSFQSNLSQCIINPKATYMTVVMAPAVRA